MFKSLEIENFRGFERFRLGGLKHVNLLVGKNNCGKTTILEAVNVLAMGGDPFVLADIARRRGEFVSIPQSFPGVEYPDISRFFQGFGFDPHRSFRLAETTIPIQTLVRARSIADGLQLPMQPELGIDIHEVGAIEVECRRGAAPATHAVVPVDPRGAGVFAATQPRKPRGLVASGETLSPVKWIGADSLGVRSMAQMWDSAIVERRETEAVEAMRIVEPRIKDVFFLSPKDAAAEPGGVVIGFEGSRHRVPLASQGEGLRRLLGLSLAIVEASGGILLVDEIDTGLHYSILGQLWLLVINAAKQSGIQVFATTHSFDCIRGLAWVCENYPALRDDISLQKIETSLDEAVALDAEQIIIATEQGIEVR